jgi:hypothetical protein
MTTTFEEPIVSLRGYVGELPKPIFEMTEEERKSYYKAAAIKTRDYLFSIGQALVYERNGQIVSESSNGKIEVII